MVVGSLKMRILVICLLSLVFAGGAHAQSTYQIRPGDTLDISVLEDANLNRQVLVRPDGRISLPLVGDVMAAGQSPESLKAAITAGIASNFSIAPNVTVALSSVAVPVVTSFAPQTLSIYMLGEVNNPGAFEVAPGTTLLQALSVAGGLGRFAASKRIQIRTTDPKSGTEYVNSFNYDNFVNGGATGSTFKLNDGDVIIVPERHLFE
jgi:polysaccharide export outer membrane protein